MAGKSVKAKFHKLVDDFSDMDVLEHVYEIMLNAKGFLKQNRYEFWDTFPEKKKKELISIVKEIKRQYNLSEAMDKRENEQRNN